jgi:hypothetical protein
MSFSLVELGQTEEHRPLLREFEISKGRCRLAASHPLLPDHVLVSTDSGFIQLASLTSSSFRLFLPALEDTVLRVPYRCFAFSATGTHVSSSKLLFSFSHDNDLRVGQFGGALFTLHSFPSRPAAIFSGPDYLVAGDSSGVVAVWRNLVSEPALLWISQAGQAGTSNCTEQSGVVVVGFEDFSFRTFDANTGAPFHEFSLEADIPASLKPYKRSSLLIAFPSGLMHLCAPTGVPEQIHVTQFRVVCADVHDELVVVGCDDGEVAVLQLSNSVLDVNAALKVSGQVIHVALSGAHLVVVTSEGGIWRWSIDDVLRDDSQVTERTHEPPQEETFAGLKQADALDQWPERAAPATATLEHSQPPSVPVEERVAPFPFPVEPFPNQPKDESVEVIMIDDRYSVDTPCDTQGGDENQDLDAQPDEEEVDAQEVEPQPPASAPTPSPRPFKALRAESVNKDLKIDGLKSGRLRTEATLRTLLDSQAATAMENSPQLHTSARISEGHQSLLEANFDPKAFRASRADLVKGIAFAHPIQAVRYEDHERVLSPTVAGTKAFGKDELMHHTTLGFKRAIDPTFEQHRAVPAPYLADHLCHEELFPSASSVGQCELTVPTLVKPQLLILPLSLAPTPAIF